MNLFEHDGGSLSVEDFTNALKSLDVKEDDTIFVHSDIRFGRLLIDKRDLLLDSLIKSVIDTVPFGTAIMPTFSYSFCRGEPYHVDETPSIVGVLTERFRKMKGVKRTLHPIFSVGIWGQETDKYLNVSKDSFGKDSIFGLIHRNNAKIVMFGSPFETSATLLHYIEKMHGIPYRFIKLFSGIINDGKKEYQDDATFFVRYLDKNVELNTANFEKHLKKIGALKEKTIGGSRIAIIESSKLYDEGFKFLDYDLYSFLKEKPKDMLRLQLEKLPFYYGMINNHLNPMPNTFPFKLIYDFNSHLIIQESNNAMDTLNENVYKHSSSLSTPLDKGTFGKVWSNDIITAIKRNVDIRGKSILEIGCNTGFLLYLLKKEGAASCIGIEPDPIAKKNKYAVKIINDFFKPEIFKEKFDLVLMHGVLEHIKDPLIFLGSLKKILKSEGVLFNAVPNCEKGLKIGDLTLLAHEHYNYFTPNSLKNIYNKAGFGNITFDFPKYGWMIYSFAKQSKVKQICKSDYNLLKNYITQFHVNIRKLQKIIDSYKKIGVYGVFPQCLMFSWQNTPVFYDGDKAKHGKFIPGFTNPIEDPETIVDGKLDAILIIPINHDAAIKSYLTKRIKKTKIISLKEIYEKEI